MIVWVVGFAGVGGCSGGCGLVDAVGARQAALEWGREMLSSERPDSRGHARLIKPREQDLAALFITKAPIEALDHAVRH